VTAIGLPLGDSTLWADGHAMSGGGVDGPFGVPHDAENAARPAAITSLFRVLLKVDSHVAAEPAPVVRRWVDI
jgi:hypothetical protein